jgi:hypothetical protein
MDIRLPTCKSRDAGGAPTRLQRYGRVVTGFAPLYRLSIFDLTVFDK